MSFKYIKDFYGIEVKRGQRVKCRTWDGWTSGTIASCSHYIHVKPDNWPNARLRYHPEDNDNLILK